MKLMRQFGIITGICFIGEVIQRAFNLPLPGSILGMIILFLCLYTGLIKLDTIREVSGFLIDHLAFFFIPAAVGLLNYADVIRLNIAAFLVISLVSTILVIVTTGHTIQILKRGKGR